MTQFRTGNGAAWLDLLASLRGRYRTTRVDTVDSPALLRGWLRQFGLEPVAAVTAVDLAAAHEVREALHRAAVAAVRAEPASTADVRVLERALAADEPIRLRRGGESGLTLGRPATAAQALARLVRDAVQDLTGPQRGHLRACGDDTCSGIFLDHTGRRRWCSDQQCGNRMRVAAHRARARGAAPS